jgi:hypothetical protein
LKGDRHGEAQGAAPRHAWACAHAYIGVPGIACIERGVSLLERLRPGCPRCLVAGALDARHLAWSCARGPCAWLVWAARSNVFARLARRRHMPNQHLDCEECLHATTGRSWARRRRLGGSGPRGQPRAAPVSHIQALRGRGRRGARRPGRIPCRKLSPHFDCSYTHSPSVAGAFELTPCCMAASGRCGAWPGRD